MVTIGKNGGCLTAAAHTPIWARIRDVKMSVASCALWVRFEISSSAKSAHPVRSVVAGYEHATAHASLFTVVRTAAVCCLLLLPFASGGSAFAFFAVADRRSDGRLVLTSVVADEHGETVEHAVDVLTRTGADVPRSHIHVRPFPEDFCLLVRQLVRGLGGAYREPVNQRLNLSTARWRSAWRGSSISGGARLSTRFERCLLACRHGI